MNQVARIVRGTVRRAVDRFPMRWRLRLRCWYHRHWEACEPELRYLHRFIWPGKTAVDVGANLGFYSVTLLKSHKRVIAFEINPALTKELRGIADGRIEIRQTGLSSSSGAATLHVPILYGRELTGWASLRPGNCPDTDEHVELPVQIERLDHYELQDVDFIKVDVEGHELEVLRGGVETIRRCKPTLLVEVKPDNETGVAEFLEPIGYRRYTLQELIGRQGSEENYIFLPKLGPG